MTLAREPGIIHHARLGSMESNVFTIIGNRMKGRRACWSINGGNRLAALLCKHYSVNSKPETKPITECITENAPLSASKTPKTDGKGYELKNISRFKPLSDIAFLCIVTNF